MIDAVIESTRPLVLTAVLCLTRTVMATLVVPFLGGESVQVSVRSAIAVSVSLVLFPLVAPTVPRELTPPVVLAALFLKEAILGFLLGFVAAKLFWVALGVGMVVDNQRGASMAEMLDPSSSEQVSPMGQFLQQTVIALFYASGGFLVFLAAVFQSYVVWPVFTFYPQFSEAFPVLFLGLLDDIMHMIIVLTAPLMITLFLSEFGLGLINRFAPQLNVFSLSMPIKSLVAVVVMVCYLPYLMHRFQQEGTHFDNLLPWLQSALE